jgi:hypothetical protein
MTPFTEQACMVLSGCRIEMSGNMEASGLDRRNISKAIMVSKPIQLNRHQCVEAHNALLDSLWSEQKAIGFAAQNQISKHQNFTS